MHNATTSESIIYSPSDRLANVIIQQNDFVLNEKTCRLGALKKLRRGIEGLRFVLPMTAGKTKS
jgi:hypothetical protein